VFGLSGLRTWEVVKDRNGKHNGQSKDRTTDHRADH
jgi:hypothetical protein